MSDMYSVAVIGLGIMGRRMIEALESHSQFETKFIWDPSNTAIELAKERTPNAEVTDSPETAIASADVVYLACQPIPRRVYSMMVSDLGVPLFLEKPLGVNLEASRSMVNHLERTQCPVAVNFVQATDSPLAIIQEALASGEMGELVGLDISVSYASWPRQWQKDADWLRFSTEGGMTREVISHFMFFAERLMGTTHLNWAHPTFPDELLCETNMVAQLSNKEGVPLNVRANVGGVQPDQQGIFVKGSKKSFKVEQFSELWSSDGGSFEQIVDPGENSRITGLHQQLDHFSKCIRGEPHLLATVQEALSVQEKIEAMLSA